MKYNFQPRGVCSRMITLDVEDNKIKSCAFMGGCHGNLQGISSLVKGMNVDEAIAIHEAVAGRMQDSYGIGTHLTCDVDNVKAMNIVVKLTAAKITEKRTWKKVVKLSDDLGKYTGDPEEIEICKKTLEID